MLVEHWDMSCDQPRLLILGLVTMSGNLQGQHEAAEILAEENVDLMTEDERQQASQLNTLTGAPLPNDILLHALPVCGPYSALQTCRFKLKIVPGSQKKGKAARQVSSTQSSCS